MIEHCTPDLFVFMRQPPVQPLGEAYARSTDPHTSHEAAESVRGEEANRMEKLVLETLRTWSTSGMTNHELCEHLGLPWNTVTPRIRPLVRKGLVVDSGEKRVGPTNRRCIVWKCA